MLKKTKIIFIKLLTSLNIFKIDLFEIIFKISSYLTGRNRSFYDIKHEFKSVLRFLDKIDIFIDAGANKGFYSDLVLKKNCKANIFLIEPNKKNNFDIYRITPGIPRKVNYSYFDEVFSTNNYIAINRKFFSRNLN
jgi:hypothetical protein